MAQGVVFNNTNYELSNLVAEVDSGIIALNTKIKISDKSPAKYWPLMLNLLNEHEKDKLMNEYTKIGATL